MATGKGNHFAVISNPEKTRFGIQAENGEKTALFSPDLLQMAHWAALFERMDLSPVHLHDVVRDLTWAAVLPDQTLYRAYFEE